MVVKTAEETEKLSLAYQLVDLATSLRQERLFVISEQHHLQQLNNDVSKAWFDLLKLVWISWQQRICINKLSISHCEYSPASCCVTLNNLEKISFEEAHKVLSYQTNIYCTQLLIYLKNRPELLAQCLSTVNQTQPEFLSTIVESIILGLYGCCLLPDDKILVLKLLLHLTHLQLVTSDDPLRLLRHGSCSFARLYSLFHEGLYSATLFLTAALHSPIMNLLMEDEKFLDIDPDKALIRFAAAERLRMFGIEGTTEYRNNLQKYRLWTINKLVAITNKFIDNIKAHIHCFPSSICWLVRHIYHLLINAGKLQEKQIFALCVDLVITSFICPAIVNPESYGIIDAPVSYITRYNLIQVAKILQMLAMRKYEPVDSKVADLYKHFDKDCLSSIIHILLKDVLQKEELDREPNIVDSDNQLKQMARSVTAFFTEQQLHNLISFLQLAVRNDVVPKSEKCRLEELLKLVVYNFSLNSNFNVSNISNTVNKNVNEEDTTFSDSLAKKQIHILSKAVNKTKISAAAVASSVVGNSDNEKKNDLEYQSIALNNNKCLETVLMFSLEDDSEIGMLGLLSEEQVLQNEKCEVIESNVCDVLITNNNCAQPSVSQTKTLSTCCSSQDGEEIVSEAGSNQSENSSIDSETEDQNDNLSDMISANVSGRGTPNISGRDTPSSQIMENENEESGTMEQVVDSPTPSQSKQPRFDLDDKFGKFEIKKLPQRSGDETVSLVSDSWSTDVLASDSENIEQNQSNNVNINSVFACNDAFSMFRNSDFPRLMDISETASEGWSTDVIVSDSDRVTEIDTDDTASVARSDITTRSEMESRGEIVEMNTDETPTSPNASTSNAVYLKKDLSNQFTDSTAEPLNSVSVTDQTNERALIMSMSQNANNSQSKLHINNDSEEIRLAGGDVTNTSIHSTPSISSSCSSVGIGEVENVQTKQYSCTEQFIVNSNQISTVISSSVTSISSISSSVSNGCAIIPGEKLNRPSSIIKSISFDKTAEKGDKDDDKNKQRVGFFKNIKQAFKNRRRDSTNQWNDSISGSLSVQYSNNIRTSQESSAKIRLNRSDSGGKLRSSLSSINRDTSEDILAKYRKQASVPNSTSAVNLIENNDDKESDIKNNNSKLQLDQNMEIDDNDSDIHCETFVFENAKKKLRFVLSNTEIQLPCSESNLRNPLFNVTYIFFEFFMNRLHFGKLINSLETSESTALLQSIPEEVWCHQENILVAFLHLQLAEARHLKDRSLIAHLHETIRCVRTFDNKKCHYLFETLKNEYKTRVPYLSYLMRCRQTLLSIIAHLNRLIKRLQNEQDVNKNFFASLCTRLFLQKKEQLLLQFATEFQDAKLADEKNDLLRNFLEKLELQIDTDYTWHDLSIQQSDLIKTAMERSVISRVYMHAMFPNGDGDMSRDEVLKEHIKKLSKIISPVHKDLCIPKKYHCECPWPAAQEELIVMSAYKTPAEKLKCILRCTQAIQNLLCLACHDSVPSADDLVPILVYVIIMANPSSLLSTIQYINSFYGNRLNGEEQYWWVQFCSAVEYIKTMDYTS